MARARYAETVTDPSGRPVPGTAVEVFQTGTVTPVAGPIYADATTAATLTNPFTANDQGEFAFYLAAPARVDLRFSKSGYTAETHTVDVLDAEHAHSGTYERLATFDVVTYGADITGVADSTAAVAAAIQAAYAAGGGTVLFPEGIVRCNSALDLPHDGVVARASQPPIVLRGVGAPDWNGNLADTTDLFLQGSVLDLRDNTAAAKIITRGLGMLTLEGLTLTDRGTSSTPFLLTINTTLRVRDCAFVGNVTKSGTTCDQDAIVLGGTSAVSGNGDTNAFSGYGTVIDGNLFHRIRRGVYGRARCNAVSIDRNLWTTLCGADVTAAAVEMVGTGSENAGHTGVGNTVEVTNYAYAFKLIDSQYNAFYNTGLWDAGAGFTAGVRLEGTSGYNTFDPIRVVDATKALSNPSANPVIMRVDKTFVDGLVLGGGQDKNFVRPASATGVEAAKLWAVYRSGAEATSAGLLVHSVRQDALAELAGANSALRFTATPGSSTYVGYVGIAGSNMTLARYAAGTIAIAPQAGGIVDVSSGVFKLPRYTTAARPSAATSGAGACYYDTTIAKPAWSDGTAWRDAAGTAV